VCISLSASILGFNLGGSIHDVLLIKGFFDKLNYLRIKGRMMKKIINVLFLSASILLLSGCKTYLTTDVKLSKLVDANTDYIDGNIYIEVPSCTSYDDSRVESKSLKNIKSRVPVAFKDAVFKECFSQKMNSFAMFTIPIHVSRSTTKKDKDNEHINIVHTSFNFLGVSIPSYFSKRAKKTFNNNGVIDMSKTTITFNVLNDTKKSYSVRVFGSFIGGTPGLSRDINIEHNQTAQIVLSDVSSSQAFIEGFVPVIVLPK